MVASPEQTVLFLKERVRPTDPVKSDQLKRVLIDLDSDKYNVRMAAAAHLTEIQDRLDNDSVIALKQGRLPVEARRLVDKALAQPSRLTSELLQQYRAIQILETIGTNEAVSLLKALATGHPTARQTREAKAALERIAH